MTLPISAIGTTTSYACPAGTPLNVSIVTRLRNRKNHLLQALPTWLLLPVQELVIVDWSSDDGNPADLVRYLKDDRVKVVRVEGRDGFERSKAWNTGIAHATAEWVMLLDADVKVVGNPFADPVFSLPNYDNFFRLYSDSHAPHLFGSAILLKEQWQAVGGFNDDLEGWGWEDVDFYARMKNRYTEITLPIGHYQPIPHDDAARTAGHAEKDLKVSCARNAYLAHHLTKIDIDVVDTGVVFQNNTATLQRHYRQSTEYRHDRLRLDQVTRHPGFASLVKRFNLFTTPTDISTLFQMPEFKEFERVILAQGRTGKARARRRSA